MPFRYLPPDEFENLSTAEKLAYLHEAVRAMTERLLEEVKSDHTRSTNPKPNS